MSDSLRNLFHKNKLHGNAPSTVKVLVSLNASPSDLCLAALREIGLSVTSVAGNKLTGQIKSSQVPELKKHASVIEVERSVKLKPTVQSKDQRTSGEEG